jgi:hypothetical protein
MDVSPSLILALIWLIAANVAAMIPSRDQHRARARLLIGVGLPLLVWVFVQNGPWIGLLVLAAAGSVLRWPLFFLLRWMRARFREG